MLNVREDLELYENIQPWETTTNVSLTILGNLFECLYTYCNFEYLLIVEENYFVNMRNLFHLGAIHLRRPMKIEIFRTPFPVSDGLTIEFYSILFKITINVDISKTPPSSPCKPDGLDGHLLALYKAKSATTDFICPTRCTPKVNIL